MIIISPTGAKTKNVWSLVSTSPHSPCLAFLFGSRKSSPPYLTYEQSVQIINGRIFLVCRGLVISEYNNPFHGRNEYLNLSYKQDASRVGWY